MPQKSRFKLSPLKLGKESLGQRIARLRKEKGFTQQDLAERIGIVQALISEYERDKRRPNYEMIIRLSMTLDVTTDELLGIKKSKKSEDTNPNKKLLRRVKELEELPPSQKKFILRTLDTLLKAAQK